MPPAATGLWLGRFTDAQVLSATQAFRIVQAADVVLGRRVVVVAAQDSAEPLAAADALDALYRAHHEPPHPVIAPACERLSAPGVGAVVFDFPARLDLEGVMHLAVDTQTKAEVDEVDGVTAGYRDAILASGARVDPITGRPMCLGTMLMANVLFAADGRSVLLGFGHNVAAHDEHGRFVARGRIFQAMEVASGAPPTAISDFVAMVRMTRMALAFVKIPEAIIRCYTGQPKDEDAELRGLLVRFETQVVSSTPDLRPPMAEILRISARLRELIGSSPDPDAFRERVAAMVRASRPDLLGEGTALVLGRDVAWFEKDGVKTELAPLLGRLLGVLVAARRRQAGAFVPADELVATLWPGERMSHSSARNRLYVAVNALRKTGIEALLEQAGGGYRLAPSVVVLDPPPSS